MSSCAGRHLLILIPSMVGGGAERVTANLANHWAARGWKITLVTLASPSLDVYDLHPAVDRIALHLAGASGGVLVGLWQNLRRVRALRRLLRRLQPDVALAMMTDANVLLAMAAKGVGVRAVGSEHVHPPQYPLGWVWERLRRHTYGGLYALTALTEESAQWLRQHTNARRVVVIPNAVPWPLPVGLPAVEPTSILRAGRHLLLAVGRMEPQKGFDLLLEAFARLASSYPSWDLVVLGDGAQRANLEQQLHGLGLAGRVWLPGRVGNIGSWYEHADLYVLSSRFEGFGNTLGEAMAHGVPVVSFDCESGPHDIVRHDVDGILVPPGDLRGLGDAMARLMGDAELRRRFGERARETRERFSLQRVAAAWETLFAAAPGAGNG